MTRKWEPPDPDDFVQQYLSGIGVKGLSEIYGVSITPIQRVLREQGVSLRGNSEARIHSRRDHLKWMPSDPAEFVRQYQIGVSIKTLADKNGVSRPTIGRALADLGVVLRTVGEAAFLTAAAKSPEQRMADSMAGRRGIQGKPRPYESLVRRAQAVERNRSHTSADELLLAEWLADLNPVPQKACGKYNIDLAIGDAVAVEIFGGKRHSMGRHATRHQERTRYLFDSGWSVIFVWVDRRNRPLRPALADYISAHMELTRRDPTLRGQYRVVWGNGEDVTHLCPQFDEIARVPPLVTNLDRRT